MAIEVGSATDSKEAVNAAQGDLAQNAGAKAPVKESKEELNAEAVAEKLDATVNAEEINKPESEKEIEEEVEEAETKPKKLTGSQRKQLKIDQLAAEKETLRRENDRLRLEALEKKVSPVKDEKVEAKTDAEPKADSFATHAEYLKAQARWEAKQEFAAQKKYDEAKAKENAARADFQAKEQKVDAKINEFKKAHEDFDDLMSEAEDALKAAGVKNSIAVHHTILESEFSAELMYELAKNPEEYVKICKMNAGEAFRALGKIEVRIESRLSKDDSAESSKESKTTKAPAPIKPVGAKASSGKKSLDDPNLSQREWEKLRKEQSAQNRA